MTALRIILIVIGLIISFAAVLAFAVEVIAFIDPVGSQGANDDDPFGPPPPRYVITLQALVSLLVGGLAVWLVVHHVRKLLRGV